MAMLRMLRCILISDKLQELGWKPEIGLIDMYKRMIESMLATKQE